MFSKLHQILVLSRAHTHKNISFIRNIHCPDMTTAWIYFLPQLFQCLMLATLTLRRHSHDTSHVSPVVGTIYCDDTIYHGNTLAPAYTRSV